MGLTVGEGGTVLESAPALALLSGVGDLLLKREDFNPSGSHKDRGLLYQVARHAPRGGETFVLSSSGNAAISAAAACACTRSRLLAFVSPRTAAQKMARLLASEAVVIACPKPINFARYAARVFGLTDLRGTKDPVASIGYRSIAGELSEQAPRADALFTFSSSGISINGIADGFVALGRGPALWAVQSGECLGIVRALRPDTPSDPESPAGRLGVRNPPGADALAERLVATGGGALAVSTDQVRLWQRRLEDAGIETSAEGAAVLAGIGATPGLQDKQVIGIMTGRGGGGPQLSGGSAHTAGSYLEVRNLLIDQLGLMPL
jgi:threonine synthase